MTTLSRVRTAALAGVSAFALGIGGAASQTATFEVEAALATNLVQALNYGLAITVNQVGDDAELTATIGQDGLPANIAILGTIGGDQPNDVSGNTAIATAYANRAVSLVEDGGFLGAESFGGDDEVVGDANGIGIASSQLAVGVTVTAEITNVRVGALVDIDDDAFTSTFTVGDNTLTALATGNDGLTSIAFDGISVEGASTSPGSTLTMDTGAAGGEGSLDGLLGTLSVQGNEGNTIDASVTSVTVGTGFIVSDEIVGGTSVVRRNSLAAVASGNITDHAITVEAAGDFDASAAIASLQENTDTDITATLSGVTVGSIVGSLSEGATVMTAGNRIDGVASGNVADLEIGIEATNLQAGTGLATADADIDGESLTMVGGVTAAIGQVNINSPVVSDVSGVLVGARLVSTSDAAAADSTVVVDENRVTSSAMGNAATTGVTLSGATAGGDNGDEGTFSAGIGSAQYSGSPVTATLSGSQIGIASVEPTAGAFPGGPVEDSTFSIVRNQMIASATANSVNNTLSAEGFAAVTVGSEDGIGHVDTANAIDGTQANSVLALSSNQQYEGEVLASNIGSEIGIRGITGIGGEDGSVLALNRNVIGSAAQGNLAVGSNGSFGNVIQLDVLTLDTVSGFGDNLAALTSIQESGADVMALTEGARIGTWNNDTVVENSTLSVVGNAIFAAAEGSVAENLITARGASYVGGHADDAAAVANNMVVSREFSLLNVQQEMDEVNRVVSATVTDYNIDVDVETITDSVAIVSNNVVQALARDNNALNVIELGTADSPFATLATSAAVLNMQQTSATVTATIEPGTGNAFLGIHGNDAASGSPLVVQGNQLDARAEGNRAHNVVTATAADLSGGDLGVPTNAGSTGTGFGETSVTADYAVLNSQSNSGPINASVTGGTMGVMMGGAGTMTDTLASVNNNRVTAGGFANLATNQIALASASATSGTAGISSTQFNSGDVTATVTGMMAGVVAGASGSGTTNIVSGNSIAATAAGNTVVNTISRTSF